MKFMNRFLIYVNLRRMNSLSGLKDLWENINIISFDEFSRNCDYQSSIHILATCSSKQHLKLSV